MIYKIIFTEGHGTTVGGCSKTKIIKETKISGRSVFFFFFREGKTWMDARVDNGEEQKNVKCVSKINK